MSLPGNLNQFPYHGRNWVTLHVNRDDLDFLNLKKILRTIPLNPGVLYTSCTEVRLLLTLTKSPNL